MSFDHMHKPNKEPGWENVTIGFAIKKIDEARDLLSRLQNQLMNFEDDKHVSVVYQYHSDELAIAEGICDQLSRAGTYVEPLEEEETQP